MVFGGSVGWSKAGPYLGLCGMALALANGCGSRTSMLEQEGYVPTGGTGASSSSGGSAGRAGNPSGGGSSSVDPKRAEPSCKGYCKGYQALCSADLGGRDCVSTCVGEASNGSNACQSAAMAVLDCFAPFFKAGETCESASARGASRCGPQLARYNECLPTRDDGPDLDPPDDTPTPSRCLLTQTGGDAANCFVVYECSGVEQLVACSTNGDGGQSCLCTSSPTLQTFEYGRIPDPCLQASRDCGLP